MAKLGYCQCGCGVKTRIAKFNKKSRGYIKGRPIRYLVGHGSRLSPVEYIEQDMGYKTPCWVWQKSLRPNGYAQMPADGTIRLSHIVYYERRFGRVPKGKMLDHLCRIRRCVNPDHMETVSNQVNSQRGNKSKINPEIVARIRALRASGLFMREIASQLGIGRTTVVYVCQRRIWNNV
jgi:hypothetical protein